MTHVRPENRHAPATPNAFTSPGETPKDRLSREHRLAADPAIAPPAGRRSRRGLALNLAVMTFSAGIFSTVALPAHASVPVSVQAPVSADVAAAAVPAQEPQNVVVPATAEPLEAVRDDFDATTVAELEAKRKKEREAREARERAEQEAREAAERQEQQAAAATSGAAPAAPAAPAAAAAPSANGGSIVDVARQYLGVPYVFGGASPSGFDCSGLTMYVYAQFGISLPHSSAAQGAGGTRVSSPVPGDLVIIDGGSHVGIYTGGGNMIDAPMPGRVVNERPIYSGNHYFVRY